MNVVQIFVSMTRIRSPSRTIPCHHCRHRRHQLTWNKTPNEVERNRLERRETFLDIGFGNETGYYDVTESPPRPLPRSYRLPLDPGGETLDETIPTGPGLTGTNSSRPSPRFSSSPSSSRSSSFVEVAGKYSTQIFADRALEVGLEGSEQ